MCDYTVPGKMVQAGLDGYICYYIGCGKGYASKLEGRIFPTHQTPDIFLGDVFNYFEYVRRS